MPLGIRPTNDFAFKKCFGTPENKPALIGLLNAILDLPVPIADVTIENPFNLKDYQDDKGSILDIKAIDQSGAIYDIEMQVAIYEGVLQRAVFYGCELFAGQLKSGLDYIKTNPVFVICILDGKIWEDSAKVHHAFRFADEESGRVLDRTLEIHTLELGCYTKDVSRLKTASLLDCWLYWFLYGHEHELGDLLQLFPQDAIRQATLTLARIADITEDKAMYDAREKAIRDQQWYLSSAFRKGKNEGLLEGKREGKSEGKLEGEIKLIQTLQELSLLPVSQESDLRKMTLMEMEAMTSKLREQLRSRTG